MMDSRDSLDRVQHAIKYLCDMWPEGEARHAHRWALTILHNAEREIIEHFYPRMGSLHYRSGLLCSNGTRRLSLR
jgi:hypothetical protein